MGPTLLNLDRLNTANDKDAFEALHYCCASEKYCRAILALRPFASERQLLEAVDNLWWKAGEAEWLASFKGHPKIGDLDSLKET